MGATPALPLQPVTDPTLTAIQNMETAVSAAPELQKAPGAAVDVSTAGGNVPAAAQSVAAAGNRQPRAAAAASVNQASGGGLFSALGSLGHDVAHVGASIAGDAMKAVNMPLQAVQHEWRYLRDVDARHGFMAALGEGLVIVGAAAAGAIFTGGVGDVAEAGLLAGAAEGVAAGGVEAGAAAGVEGAAATAGEGVASTAGKGLLKQGFHVLGRAANLAAPARVLLPGEAAGYAMAHALHPDSWNRTASSTYRDPHTGELVNFGNDVAGFIGLKGGAGTVASATSNAIFDIFGDPVASVGKMVAGAKSIEGLTVAGRTYSRAFTSENIERQIAAGTDTVQGKNLDRALGWLADANSGQILGYDRRLAAMVPDRMMADTAPATDEMSAFRYGPPNEGVLDPLHPQGAYYTPDGSPSSYGAHGGVKYEVFLKRDGHLALGGANATGNREAWNAGTSAIEKVAGKDELHRLTKMMDQDPRLVADELKQKFGITLAPGTGSELDVYGATLARNAGYKSMRYAETAPGYNDEVVALARDAMRSPEGHHLVKGLGNASTKDEVADVLRRHAATNETTAGSTLPSMSYTKLGMTKLREAMDAGKTDYLHPVLGGIRHPSSALGNLSHLTSRIPGTSYDETTKTFTKDTVNLTSLKGMDSLRSWYALGMGRDQADSIIHLLYNSDVATRHVIHRNASLMTMLGHAGLDFGETDMTSTNWFDTASEAALNNINKPKFREFMQRQIDSLQHPVNPDASGHYMGVTDGSSGPKLLDAETHKEHAAAVLLSQTGDMPLMPYSELHHTAQKLAGAMTFTGSLDDFMMKHVTDPIFKRWILMSLGYAQHISAAEMIPNTFRLGFQRSAKAAYYVSLGKMANRVVKAGDVTPAEMDAVTKFAYRVLQRAPRNDAEMRRVMDFATGTGGSFMTPGTEAGHGLVDTAGDDALGRSQHGLRSVMEATKYKRGDNYTLYGPENREHIHSWGQWLGLQAKDPMARAAAGAMRDAYKNGATTDEAYRAGQMAAHESLKSLTPDTLSGYMGSKLKAVGASEHQTPLEGWSHRVAQNVQAATHSPTGEVNSTLLRNVADGRMTMQSALHRVDVTARPLGVPGRELIPSGEHALARLSSVGYERVLQPIVNFLSRQPMTYAEFSKRMDVYAHMETTGLVTHDELVTRALSEATIDSVRFIHNIQDRTVMDQLLRNWVPFFFAQEQAYRRAGRLLMEDPGAFRRYQLAIAATHNVVAKQKDAAGNQYFAFPGAGWLDHLVVGGLGVMGMPTASLNPTGFGGTLSAANVVFPLSNGIRPDLSPVVTLAVQQVSHLFEEFGAKYASFTPVAAAASGALTGMIGSTAMSQSVLQQLIPNTTAYRVLETAMGDDTSFTSAMLMTLQNLAYQQNVATRKWQQGGQKGPMPSILPGPNADPGQLQLFLSRVKSQTRAVFFMRSIIGFASPVSAQVTVNDFGLNAKLQADITSQKSVSLGFQKFLHDNPDATPYVVAKSTTATGAKLPDTQGALNWVSANAALLKSHQYGAMWLMPRLTDTTYSSSAYLEEIASGMRVRKTPEQYLNSLYAENGDQVYYNALAQHEAALQASPGGTTQEYAKWDAYMQMLQKQQPIWFSQFNSGQRVTNAQNSINELTDIFAKGLQPNTQQSTDVGNLLSAFQQAEQAYTQAGAQSNYSSQQKIIRDQWIQYVTQLAVQEPQLDSIISSVFKSALTSYNLT